MHEKGSGRSIARPEFRFKDVQKREGAGTGLRQRDSVGYDWDCVRCATAHVRVGRERGCWVVVARRGGARATGVPSTLLEESLMKTLRSCSGVLIKKSTT
jgi:hypothetical protein